MIGENESTVNRATAAGAANLHPTRCERCREVSEAPGPPGSLSGRGREDQRTRQVLFGRGQRGAGGWKINSGIAVDLRHSFDGPMREDGTHGQSQPLVRTLIEKGLNARAIQTEFEGELDAEGSLEANADDAAKV